jgi:predicted acylesterase/phospholipase RssA
VSCLAVPAALIAVGADLREHFTCLQMLDGAIDEGVVAAARQARWWKLFGFKSSAITGLSGGVISSLMTPAVLEALPAIWELVVRAHRFALRARFSVLAGAVFTVLLLTGPGEDIVRTIATGAFWGEVAGTVPPKPDFARLGWFGVALLILAATCWGWARLVFAVRFATPDQRPPDLDEDRRRIEDRLRRDLPIYYGSVPFVAAASAFAIAPLREGSASRFPTTQFFAGSLAPLLLFFILPLALVIFRAKTNTSRKAVGPLSWTLIGYGALAALHAAVNWTDLHLLGVVPLVLVATAFVVFGVGQPCGIFILPAALLGGAAAHDRFGAAAVSAVVLVVIGAVVSWLATRVQGVDELYIPKSFDRSKLLRLTISNATRDEMSRQIEADEVGYTELRHMQEAAPRDPKDEKRPTAKLSEEVVGKLRSLLRFCGVLVVFQFAVFVVALARPQEFAALIGSGAMLALGLAGLATAGSALLFITQATRFPILGAALFIAVLCSGAMDNHAIRLAGSPSPEFIAAREAIPPKDDPGPIGAAFEQWRALATTPGNEPPCIIVAAEGGGIRAALWPAIVLGTLQDESLARRNGRPDFASHVFAVSGVSGGSVGAAVFTALCAEKRDSEKIRGMAATLCGADHLAPTLGALLYPDFVQRFLPVALLPDRAAAFEGSWEHAWPSGAGVNRFAQSFSALWAKTDHIWLPALFFNTTMVETGKRAICSNLPIRTAGGGQFIDAQDFHANLRDAGPGAGAWQDVPLSAAVHASARFPIVSPPGRLPSGARVVDGGYFENSAATTGIDVLNAVTKRLDQTQGSTKLIFIFLRYADSAGLSDTLEESQSGPSPAIPDEDAPLHAKTNPLNETGGIVGTLLATRAARGSYSQDAVFHRYLARQNVVVLSFTFRGEKIPLSWSLSQRSCNDMLRQFPKTAPGAAERIDEKTRSVIESNLMVKDRLFRELYGP